MKKASGRRGFQVMRQGNSLKHGKVKFHQQGKPHRRFVSIEIAEEAA